MWISMSNKSSQVMNAFTGYSLTEYLLFLVMFPHSRTLRKKLLKVRHRSKIIGGGGLERAYLEMWWIKTRGPSPPFAKKLTDPTLNVG